MGTGNTLNKCLVSIRQPVHPRGHGEHTELLKEVEQADGSSPWARGTLDLVNRYGSRKRFIPVGTGNTCPAYSQTKIMPVHPRGHGEHY